MAKGRRQVVGIVYPSSLLNEGGPTRRREGMERDRETLDRERMSSLDWTHVYFLVRRRFKAKI